MALRLQQLLKVMKGWPRSEFPEPVEQAPQVHSQAEANPETVQYSTSGRKFHPALTQLPVSEPVLRVAAYDPPSGKYYAVEIRGEWTGELRTEDGRQATLELQSIPEYSGASEPSRILRSLEPLTPNFVIRGEFERSP